MGIGVYESYQYVTALGGTIKFDSKPGQGTRVEVRLPLVESAAGGGMALAMQDHAA
jgi:signal transduction histidine kinase